MDELQYSPLSARDEVHTPITPPSELESPSADKSPHSVQNENGSSTCTDPSMPDLCYMSRLPNELLADILKYSLAQNNMYDVLVEVGKGNRPLHLDNEVELVSDDETVSFVLARREICLSRVCCLWRDLITMGFIDLWTVDDQTLYITGEQWFHPAFPAKSLLSFQGFSHSLLFLHFRDFCTPVQPADPLEVPLIEPPPGANFHDSHPPVWHTTFHGSMKHIHLLVSQGSNVAVDAVLGRVQFPRPLEYDPRLHGSDGGFDDEELTEYFPQTPPKRITFTISTGGRIFVMSNSSGGTAGGILSHDLVHVDFDIRSWTEGFSWEIPDSVKGVIAWIRGVEHWTVWKSQGKLRIKVPQDLEAQQELRETWAPYNRQLFPRGERGEGWARMVFPPEIHRRWDEVVLEGFGGELEPWLGFAWRGEHVMTKYLTMVLTREQFFGRFPEMRRGEVEENHEDSDGGHEKGVQILPLEQHRYRHLPDHPMSALPPPLIDVEERPLKMYVGKEQPRLARFFGEFNLMANRSIPIYYVCGEP